MGSIPGSGRSPGEGNGNPLQYSCLENSMGRGAWRATVHGMTESDTTEHACMHASPGPMRVDAQPKCGKNHRAAAVASVAKAFPSFRDLYRYSIGCLFIYLF